MNKQIMTTAGQAYTISRAEQETHIRYDVENRMWYVWTCYQSHMTEFERRGWKMTKEKDGGRWYEAPRHAIAIKNAEKRKRTMSKAQRAALMKHAFSRDNNVPESP